MIKKFLIGITLIILIAMALAAMTKPERTAHYDTLKKGLTVVIEKVVDSHPLLQQYNAISTMTALNATDEYLNRNFRAEKITVLYNSLIFNCSEMSFWRGVMI